MNETVLSWWAKRTDGPAGVRWHPLICHALDVTAVAMELWDEVTTDRLRRWFADLLQVDVASARSLVILLAGMHDIGKSGRLFQDRIASNAGHGLVSAKMLAQRLREEPFGFDESVAVDLAVVVGGHHGVIPDQAAFQEIPKSSKEPRAVHDAAREAFLQEILTVSGIPSGSIAAVPAAAAVWLAGFVSVADWIGSNTEFFPFVCDAGEALVSLDPVEYWADAREGAKRAIEQLGWAACRRQLEPRTFAELFPAIGVPNDLQRKMEALARQQDGPWLAIVEAPTGSGKTEAAFYAADDGLSRLGMAGVYVALPTQATSNQIFRRRRAYADHRFAGACLPHQLHLAHGQSSLSDEMDELLEAYRSYLEHIRIEDEPRGKNGGIPSVMAAEWFTQRKRALLAEDGVGTIDQALMSVLGTRHCFVRLFGLAGKTVIIDEVHAYDVYTSTLLERLIHWLHALDCSVILLSATLPAAKRASLAASFGGAYLPAPDGPTRYPAVTWVGRTGSGVVAIDSDLGARTFALDWTVASDRWMSDLARDLADAVPDGGCAAVICNTVDQAQRLYRTLQERFDRSELVLLHARFPAGQRATKQETVVNLFGPSGDATATRPFSGRRIVVATQVIEQSLDVDFDLVVTQLAPVDLVIQRAGRMHRHQRNHRPAGLETPRVWVIGPPEQDGLPDFDHAFGQVYERYVLERSWWTLRRRSAISVPADVPELIEHVYGDDVGLDGVSAVFQAQLERSRRAWEQARDADWATANDRLIESPDTDKRPWRILGRDVLEEDAPERHVAFQALTRLAEPSIQTIWLPANAEGEAYLPESGEMVRFARRPTLAEARDLLKHAVTIGGWRSELVRTVFEVPASWTKSALLAHSHPIVYDPATGRPLSEKWAALEIPMALDEELGVVYRDEFSRDGREA